MEWYMSQHLVVRILLPLACVGALLFLFAQAGLFDEDADPNDPRSPSPVSAPSSPVGGDPSADPTPSAIASAPPVATAAPEVPESFRVAPEDRVNELSPEDWDAAGSVASEGVRHYYAFSSSEAVDVRAKRLSKYFAKGSEYLSSTPMGDSILLGDGQSIAMQGSVELDHPIFGAEGSYATMLEVTVTLQFVLEDQDRPQVMRDLLNVLVKVDKTKDGWKIVELVEYE